MPVGRRQEAKKAHVETATGIRNGIGTECTHRGRRMPSTPPTVAAASCAMSANSTVPVLSCRSAVNVTGGCPRQPNNRGQHSHRSSPSEAPPQAAGTFWEKATAAHGFFTQERVRGEGFARPWHDLVRPHEAGVAARALADRRIARALRRIRPCSFTKRTRRETGWTTRQRWLAACVWFRRETLSCSRGAGGRLCADG